MTTHPPHHLCVFVLMANMTACAGEVYSVSNTNKEDPTEEDPGQTVPDSDQEQPAVEMAEVVCDPRLITCSATAPDCPLGMVPSVNGAQPGIMPRDDSRCWGPCVKVPDCAPICDPKLSVCREAPPECPLGHVPTMSLDPEWYVTGKGGSCGYGSCVPLNTCAPVPCSYANAETDCPPGDSVCWGTTGFCGPHTM